MKIALLTFFKVDNCGGFHQALATITELAKHTALEDLYLVDVRSGRLINKLWPSPKNPKYAVEVRKRSLNYAYWRRKLLYRYCHNSVLDTQDATNLGKFVTSNSIDLVITGADTCLDLSRGYPPSIYWIPDNVRSRKAYLSSSSGSTTLEMLKTETRHLLSKRLADAQMFFARDQATEQLIKSIAPWVNVERSPDPAFTLDTRTIVGNTKFNLPSRFEQYCILSINHSSLSHLAANYLSHKYIIYWLNRATQKRCDRSIFPGPFQQIKAISGAKVIITSSFHEVIFAIKCKTPFVAVDQASPITFGMSKLSSLAVDLGFESQVIYGSDLIDSENELVSIIKIAESRVEVLHDKAARLSDKFSCTVSDLLLTVHHSGALA